VYIRNGWEIAYTDHLLYILPVLDRRKVKTLRYYALSFCISLRFIRFAALLSIISPSHSHTLG